MRKTLILVVALFAALVFSACERVSAHSPPAKQEIMQNDKRIVIVVDSSAHVGLIAEAIAARGHSEAVIVVTENSATAYDSLAVLRAGIREFAADPSKIIAVMTPEKQREPIPIPKTNLPVLSAKSDLPPERFAGFGFASYARAKI